MTRFLRTEDDVLINAGQISRIEAHGEWRCRATLLDGSVVWIADEINFLEARLAPVVPATPGPTVLDYGEDDRGNPVISHLNVVAWRLAEGLALPVTPASDEIFDPQAGPIIHQYKRILPNDGSWMREMARQAKQRREQNANPKLRPV